MVKERNAGAARSAGRGWISLVVVCLLIPAQVVLLAYLVRQAPYGGDHWELAVTLAAQSLFTFTSDLITRAGGEWSKSVGLGVLVLGAALICVRERPTPTQRRSALPHRSAARGAALPGA